MQRYFSNKLDNNFFNINKDDLYHIFTVMRMKEHDTIEVVYNKRLFLATIENDGIKLKDEVKTYCDNIPYIVICIPLLKETKMDYILQKATELGVNEIIPVITERSIIKINDKIDSKIKRWEKICKEASEQSKRLNIPIITNVKKQSELNFDCLKLVCDTKEKQKNIKTIFKDNLKCDKIVFMVGPEGGLSEAEIKKLNAIGFISVSLGTRIMRVETVPLYLMSVINYEFME